MIGYKTNFGVKRSNKRRNPGIPGFDFNLQGYYVA